MIEDLELDVRMNEQEKSIPINNEEELRLEIQQMEDQYDRDYLSDFTKSELITLCLKIGDEIIEF